MKKNDYFYEIKVGIAEDSKSNYDQIILRLFDINTKFKFGSGFIPAKSWDEFQGTVSIYAILTDNSKRLILSDQNIEHDIDFKVPSNTKEIILKSCQDSFLVKRPYYHELSMIVFFDQNHTKRLGLFGINSNSTESQFALH